MRRMVARRPAATLALALAGLLGAVGLGACTAPKSEMCRQVCAREAECIGASSATESSFDEGECIAACAALERDLDTQAVVAGHKACVDKAETCSQVLDCK